MVDLNVEAPYLSAMGWLCFSEILAPSGPWEIKREMSPSSSLWQSPTGLDSSVG